MPTPLPTALQRRDCLALVAGGWWLAGGTQAASEATPRFQAGDDPAASPVWQKVRASLFGGRPVETASAQQLVLQAPLRATDGAVVPMAIRAQRSALGAPLERLVLVIDANPSPAGTLLQLGQDAVPAEVELRVRVDAYSHVRVVAELADGRLLQAVRFVKASGGCSAPPGGDEAAARASMGRTALRVDGDPSGTAPVQVQFSVQHPNHSGMAMDQFTRQYTPAHFVRKVEARLDGRPVFLADVDFSVSENPSFRFWVQPRGARQMQVHVEDSAGLRFDANHALDARAA